MDPHARYEDEHWEGPDLAGTEAEAVELLDMQVEKPRRTFASRDTRARVIKQPWKRAC